MRAGRLRTVPVIGGATLRAVREPALSRADRGVRPRGGGRRTAVQAPGTATAHPHLGGGSGAHEVKESPLASRRWGAIDDVGHVAFLRALDAAVASGDAVANEAEALRLDPSQVTETRHPLTLEVAFEDRCSLVISWRRGVGVLTVVDPAHTFDRLVLSAAARQADLQIIRVRVPSGSAGFGAPLSVRREEAAGLVFDGRQKPRTVYSRRLAQQPSRVAQARMEEAARIVRRADGLAAELKGREGGAAGIAVSVDEEGTPLLGWAPGPVPYLQPADHIPPPGRARVVGLPDSGRPLHFPIAPEALDLVHSALALMPEPGELVLHADRGIIELRGGSLRGTLRRGRAGLEIAMSGNMTRPTLAPGQSHPYELAVGMAEALHAAVLTLDVTQSFEPRQLADHPDVREARDLFLTQALSRGFEWPLGWGADGRLRLSLPLREDRDLSSERRTFQAMVALRRTMRSAPWGFESWVRRGDEFDFEIHARQNGDERIAGLRVDGRGRMELVAPEQSGRFMDGLLAMVDTANAQL